MGFDIFDSLERHARTDPEHPAFVELRGRQRRVVSYRQVVEEVGKIALFLHHRGVDETSAVGILMENQPHWGMAFLAAQASGARIVPFDILHPNATLAELIRHSECRFLITSEDLLPRLETIQGELPEPLPMLVCGGQGTHSWKEALQEAGEIPQLPLVEPDPEAPFLILYTSGTTGHPKGVVLTRSNLEHTVLTLSQQVPVGRKDNVLAVLPLYHILALLANFIIPLRVGARVTYLDTLDGQRILDTFVRESVTIFVCVPQFFYLLERRILKHIESEPWHRRFLFHRLMALSQFTNRWLGLNPGPLFFASLHRRFGRQFRLFGVGGARFDPAVARFFWTLGFPLLQAYGMTETSAVSTVTPLRFEAAGSVGAPSPGVKVSIVNPGSDGIGEIVVRGPHIMRGYWKDEAGTAEVLRQDGLHTGDLGYLDDRGLLHITGRSKDVIVLSSGKNVYPEELEHFYQSRCPYIKEMCVVGVQAAGSVEGQEKLHAVVVPDFDYMRSQQTINAYDMIRYMLESLSQQLPAYKRVHSFEIRRQPLPRTTTRKIRRFELSSQSRRQEATTGAAAPTGPISPREEKLFAIVRQMKPRERIERHMNLELDLGFDSLERVEFLSTVQEAFGVHLSDDRAARIFTLEELLEVLEEEGSRESAGDTQRRSWREILGEPLAGEEQEKLDEILGPHPVLETLFYLTAKVVWLLSRLFFRLRVEGEGHFSRDYPYMICPNHLSFLDAFMLVGPLPYHVLRRLFFLGYADYFNGPLMSWLRRAVKTVPVDADRHLREALRMGAEGLRRGLILCVFPEGERSIDGRLKPFRRGPAILASELKVPVIPVGISGTYQAWPRGVSRIRLHPVRLRFGEPLGPPGPEESIEDFNGRLFAAVESLLA